MSITANSLYRDTKNFLGHEIITIVLMAILTSFITVTVSHTLMPDIEQLSLISQTDEKIFSLFEIVQNMSLEQQHILLRASAIGTFATLLGNTILLGGMLHLISLSSSGHRVSVLQALKASLPLLPKLLLQTFLITMLVQLGFMVLLVPGVILAILLSLAPVMLTREKMGVLDAMQASIRLSWKNIKVIAPAIVLWLLSKIILMFFFLSLRELPINVTSFMLNSLGNIVFAILVIYLYRLYILLN